MRQISYRTVQTAGASKQHVLILDGEDLAASFNADIFQGISQMLFNTHGIDTKEIKKYAYEALIAEVNRECYFREQNELNKHEQQQIIDIVEQLSNPA